MAGSDAADVIWYVVVLVLVGSALLSRRLDWRSTAKMAIAWIAIFAVVLTAASYQDEIGSVVQRVAADLTGNPRQTVEGGRLRIAVSRDGHYWVDGTVNGIAARFLVDSGATVTALSASTANAASIAIDTQRIPLLLNTANGKVEAQRGVANRLEMGSVKMHDLPVVVSKAFGDVNVIGMNALSRLKSWRVEDRHMILEP